MSKGCKGRPPRPDLPRPVGRQGSITPIVTRRGFLVGGAATPIVLSSAFAVPPKPEEVGLEFDLSDDGKVLIIRQNVRVPRKKVPQLQGRWESHAASFGPAAWFDLHVADPAQRPRRLLVRDAAFGGATGLTLTFLFTPPTVADLNWQISLTTKMWQGARKATWSSGALGFPAFAADTTGATALRGAADGAQACHRLAEVFEDRVAGPEPGLVDLAFLADATWRLARSGGAVARILDGQMSAGRFTFGWHSTEGREPFLWGHAEAKDGVVLSPSLTLGAAPGLRLAVDARPGKPGTSAACWEVTRTQSPLVRDTAAMTYVKATLDPSWIAVADGTSAMLSRLRAGALFVTEVQLPGGDLRQVLWGDVSAVGRHWPIATAAGRLDVDAPQRPAAAEDAAKPAQAGDGTSPSAPAASDASSPSPDRGDADAAIAVGDGSGAPAATIWAVFDRAAGAKAEVVRRIAIDLALFGADLALRDAGRSALTFGTALFPPPAPRGAGAAGKARTSADLRLVYHDGRPMPELTAGEFPRREPSSFVWLGRLKAGRERARFDLSRAVLAASRDSDLMNVRFRFLDLTLGMREGAAPVIVPRHADCRVIDIADGQIRDDRPVLVVELDPQHVFEEALIGQFLPLPDNDCGATRDEILATLDKNRGNQQAIEKYRADIFAKKIEDKEFEAFALAYGRAAFAADLPKDQQIYLGPFALDPDAMALARRTLHAQAADAVAKGLTDLVDRLDKLISADQGRDPVKDARAKVLWPIDGSDPVTRLDNALRNEAVLEQQEPAYKLFRDFYRETMTLAVEAATPPKTLRSPPHTRRPLDLEFFHPSNRPAWPIDNPGDLLYVTDPRPTREQTVTPDYVTALTAADAPEMTRLMEGRLSGASRLAFRLNCAPPLQASALEAGLVATPRGTPEAPAGGGTRYGPIPFTFEGLTDWSRHEPAVTRRAQKLFEAAPDGLVPPVGSRAANLSDAANLVFQGISPVPVIADQRLGEVRAALARRPTPHETAIELPARIVLSTAQDAVWFTRRTLPAEIAALPPPAPAAIGEAVIPSGDIELSRDRLWMVRLDLEGVDPSLRVVDSPDLRPQALTSRPDRAPRQWGEGAPPRGPFAPWFVGPEQMDGLTLMPPPDTTPPVVWGLLRKLRERLRDRAEVQANDATYFRSALDACDRHELVLLSSAPGLPVIGRRENAGGSPGRLVKDAGQIEPGEAFQVLDADDSQAIQRPQPLRATELWLSALGGTLLHDTIFSPSAGALARPGGKIFDGFSIERWREEIVLGRDIVGEVVYKGYLFPFGHVASLVKLTERLFLLNHEFGVKAVLVQRVFLRVGRKSQAYPALGQPFEGRLWCAGVTVTTVQTPDLQSPFDYPPPTTCTCAQGTTCEHEVLRGGRINLCGNPGFAFWPRLNETESGLVRFGLTIDGATTTAPLIFVDAVAATTPASMGVLIPTYRSMWRDRRTLQLGDQKIRYAPETKSGDCTLKTRTIVLSASGRVGALASGWVGFDEDFSTTPILEGAEQPPFYPSLQTATIRLEQAEQFCGRDPVLVEAQFDGRYARFGFSAKKAPPTPAPPPPDAPLPPIANPLEIFLDLRTAVAISMGDHGDRGGGVGRPNTVAVAVGRANGPVGSAVAPIYQDTAPARADQPAAGSVYAPPPDPLNGIPAPCKEIKGGDRLIIDGDDATGFPVLHSLADFFDPYATPSVCAARASALGAPAAPGAQPAIASAGLSGAAASATKQVGAILKLFFSHDAEILGVVSFADLMEFLGFDEIASLADATPVLKQVLHFGAGVAEAGDDLVEEIHGHLIAPLRDTVEKFTAQWKTVSAKLGGSGGQGTLETIFPEIGTGLADLSAKLGVADADNDPVSLAVDLGEVYESARSFGEALLRIASNPTARLEQAAVGAVQNILQGFTDPTRQQRLVAALDALTAPVQAALAAGGQAVIDSVAAEVARDTASFEARFGLLLPLPDLAVLAHNTGEAVDQAATDIAGEFETRATNKLATTIVKTALGDLLAGRGAQVRGDVQAKVAKQVGDAVTWARAQITARLDATSPSIAQAYRDALEALTDDLADTALARPFWRPLVEILDYAAAAAAALTGLSAAIADKSPSRILHAAANLSTLVFGYPGPVADLDSVLKTAFDKFTGDVDKLGDAFKLELAELQVAAKACRDYRADTAGQKRPKPQPKPVTAPLRDLDQLLDLIDAASDQVVATRTYLDSTDPHSGLPIRAVLQNLDGTAQSLLIAIDDLPAILNGPPGTSGSGLRGAASDVFCAYVNAASAVRAAALDVRSTRLSALDGTFAARIVAYLRTVRGATDALGKAVENAAGIVTSYGQSHPAAVQTAGLAGVLAELAGLSGLDQDIFRELNKLKKHTEDAERDLAHGLVALVDLVVALLTDTALLASSLTATASSLAGAFSGVAGKLGLKIDAQLALVQGDIDAIGAIAKEIGTLTAIPPAAAPATIGGVLAAQVGGDPQAPISVAALMTGKLTAWKAALFDREAALVAHLMALRTRLFGSPEALKNAAFGVLLANGGTSLVTQAHEAYSDADMGWLALRAQAARAINIDVLTRAARRAVFVAPVYGVIMPPLDFEKETDPDKLSQGDRLAEEAVVLAAAAQFNPNAADADTVRNHFIQFVESWSDGGSRGAAPLQIAGQIAGLAQEVLRGEVLALVDISALRDELLDAVSQLVPTSATFSYDFASTVVGEPEPTSIFQAQKGTVFSLSTRIEVDLLKTNVRLSTGGALGPFAIHLVGDYVDALTLRFGGAKFGSEGGGAPRFDLSYEAYEVGDALAYVKQLQDYLTPSDGAGFHIGPSTLGAGIEAGYGVNFGALSLGPVSFFNIVFDVSAELPFDPRPAVFRVSLGTRLTPFTISALPYAGSGYFSIYASAAGIVGFEAGFMFGGGGSLAFGPLTAQVQLQVGASFRVMKIEPNGQPMTITEASGTFLAAGSASIWIFHFGASLFVALTQSSDGTMEGEATFTFSFACGFIHYHYSVTARHEQPAIGTSGRSRGHASNDRVAPSTQLALASLPGRLSDAAADLIAVAAVDRAGAAVPDVVSLATCQSENWHLFSSYVDLSLVREAAHA